MKDYCCTKCGSTDVFIINKYLKSAKLICGNCDSFIMRLSREEIPIVEQFIDKQRNQHKKCSAYEDGCEEWAGCPCVNYQC